MSGWLGSRAGVVTVGIGIYLLAYLLMLALLSDSHQKEVLADVGYLPMYLACILIAWQSSRKVGLEARARSAWRLLALAVLAYCVGNIIWDWYELVLNESPFPSWADPAFLLYFPLVLAGILMFPAPRRSTLDRWTMLFDMAIVLLGSGMSIWYFILRPIAVAHYNSLLENVLSLAYPLGDVVLLVAIASILFGRGRGKKFDWAVVLALGLTLFFAADMLWAYLTLQNTFTSGGWSDVLWPVAVYLILISAQMYRPDASAQMPPVVTGATKTTNPMTLLPYAALAAGYGLLLTLTVLNWVVPLSDLIVLSIALTGVVVLRQNITTRENIRLVALHARIQSSLLNELMTTQEAERHRLSIEVHDGPLQSLGVSLMSVNRAIRRYERGEHDFALKELAFLRSSLSDITGEVRSILKDLSLDVLNTYGLSAALQSHVQQFTEVTGIPIAMDNSLSRRLPGDIELLLYRLTQESLTNVRKHADATHVAIALQMKEDTIVLSIRDDGKGFDVQHALDEHEDGKGMGLRSMRQRIQATGGALTITSQVGKGTVLDFWCPISKPKVSA